MLTMHMSGKSDTTHTATPVADPEGNTPITLSSVLMVMPRWVRDGGVGAHVQESATLLARQGVEVHVLAAQVGPSDPVDGLTLHSSPELFNAAAPMEMRLGDAGSLRP